MRVENMKSITTGAKVANQFIITGTFYGHKVVTFQSYDSEIIRIEFPSREGEPFGLIIGDDWNYSRTTGKYRNAFLAEYVPELANVKALKALVDLAESNEDNKGYTTFIDRQGRKFEVLTGDANMQAVWTE